MKPPALCRKYISYFCDFLYLHPEYQSPWRAPVPIDRGSLTENWNGNSVFETHWKRLLLRWHAVLSEKLVRWQRLDLPVRHCCIRNFDCRRNQRNQRAMAWETEKAFPVPLGTLVALELVQSARESQREKNYSLILRARAKVRLQRDNYSRRIRSRFDLRRGRSRAISRGFTHLLLILADHSLVLFHLMPAHLEKLHVYEGLTPETGKRKNKNRNFRDRQFVAVATSRRRTLEEAALTLEWPAWCVWYSRVNRSAGSWTLTKCICGTKKQSL